MRLLFLGNNERGCRCLEALVHAGHQVVAVVALPERKQPQWSRNLASLAKGYSLPVYQPEDINAADVVAHLDSLEPDVVVLAGYNQLVKRPFINIARQRCINLHASPLPNYRGAAPLNWMLINGESRGALSIIEVDEGVDTGDILAQHFFDIRPEDDYRSLLDYSLEHYPPLLLATLEAIATNSLQARKQNRCQGQFYSKRLPKDGRITWQTMSAVQVHNLVRALVLPMPGAFSDYQPASSEPQRIIIEKTQQIAREYRGVAGRVAAHWPSGVIVLCADRGLLITHCRLDDGRVVAASSVMPASGQDLL